ncbi:MAG TPA: hypothetical protein VMZ28_01725 [Kofleriaceae bacterium]|nr:hypothetical protein [Kofleriaceae bacterium]
MTRLFRIVLLFAAMSAPFAMTGCEDDDPCASDDEECKSDQDELSEEQEPPLPQPENPCRQACAALIGDCDASDPSFKVNQSACTQWCKEGGLTIDETTCLSGVPCGGGVDQCFVGE